MDKQSSGWKASVMVLVVTTALLGGASWYFSSPDSQTTEQETTSAFSKEAEPVERQEDRGMPMASPFGAAPVQQAETSGITGRWIGHLDMGGNTSPAQVSLNLQVTGTQLSGTATFPIGEGSIENGKITGNQLSFSTRHRLPSSSQILLTQFTGDITNGTIALRMQTEGGESQLTVYRVPR
jgi:hypothetical protein